MAMVPQIQEITPEISQQQVRVDAAFPAELLVLIPCCRRSGTWSVVYRCRQALSRAAFFSEISFPGTVWFPRQQRPASGLSGITPADYGGIAIRGYCRSPLQRT